jgi:hypothetical protein
MEDWKDFMRKKWKDSKLKRNTEIEEDKGQGKEGRCQIARSKIREYFNLLIIRKRKIKDIKMPVLCIVQ